MDEVAVLFATEGSCGGGAASMRIPLEVDDDSLLLLLLLLLLSLVVPLVVAMMVSFKEWRTMFRATGSKIPSR